MVDKKKQKVPPLWYAVCHRQAAKEGIQKDSITGTNERSNYVEKCIMSMKKKKGIKN